MKTLQSLEQRVISLALSLGEWMDIIHALIEAEGKVLGAELLIKVQEALPELPTLLDMGMVNEGKENEFLSWAESLPANRPANDMPILPRGVLTEA